MSIEISLEVMILDESVQFMKLRNVKHLATVTVVALSNARELTEYAQLTQRSAEMYIDERKDYIHEYAVIKDSSSQLVAIMSLEDEQNYNEYMNKEVIDFSQMKYSNASIGLQGYNFSNVEYDYTNYQPQHRNASSDVILVSLELNDCGKVNSFAQLDSQVRAYFNVASQLNQSVDVEFLLEFSNNKTYRIPYTLTSADMAHFSSYGLLRSYCDLMKNCTILFTPRIDIYINQTQLDALEIADFSW